MLSFVVVSIVTILQASLFGVLIAKYFNAQDDMKRRPGSMWRLAEWSSWLLFSFSAIPLSLFFPLIVESVLFEELSTKNSRLFFIFLGCASLVASATYGWKTRRKS
jgi:hypothetical protein